MSKTISPADAREDASMGRAEAAAELGLNERTLRRYENADREPGAGVLAGMADLYGLGAQGVLKLARWFALHKGQDAPTVLVEGRRFEVIDDRPMTDEERAALAERLGMETS